MFTKPISLEWIIEKYSNLFKKFNLNEKAIYDYYNSWKSVNANLSTNDFLWSFFNSLLEAIAKQAGTEQTLYEYNYDVYKEMWYFMAYIENKNANHVKMLMHENELRLWELQQTLECQVEIISGHCCEYCDSLNQKLISFEEALSKQYLASEKCTREIGCNCCYAVVPLRNEKGRPIRRKK